ncbi:hypothetical protein GCM10022406_03130 [Hymenobacter algoricola]|uniref:Tetratricopeptide repeat protein n=2 Tax=Hymenobacter algoricola TaxID=486267 RepID=A0ABP7MD13_9BACT
MTGLCLVMLGGSAPRSKFPSLRPPLETRQVSAQVEIEKALGEALRDHTTGPLLHVRQRIRRTATPYSRYWLSYLALHESVYYLRQADRPRAEQAIKAGLALFEATPPRHAEDYALLAHLQSFAIQFHYGMAAAVASSRVKESAAQALKLDARNLRVHYVLGSNDFYTPARYGGGKKAESYLLKALALPDQTLKNTQAPSWGREQTYGLLIKLYQRDNRPELARRYYADARRLFPASTQLPAAAKSGAKPVATNN